MSCNKRMIDIEREIHQCQYYVQRILILIIKVD